MFNNEATRNAYRDAWAVQAFGQIRESLSKMQLHKTNFYTRTTGQPFIRYKTEINLKNTKAVISRLMNVLDFDEKSFFSEGATEEIQNYLNGLKLSDTSVQSCVAPYILEAFENGFEVALPETSNKKKVKNLREGIATKKWLGATLLDVNNRTSKANRTLFHLMVQAEKGQTFIALAEEFDSQAAVIKALDDIANKNPNYAPAQKIIEGLQDHMTPDNSEQTTQTQPVQFARALG